MEGVGDVKIKIKKLRENAVVPKLATEGAAAFDLYAIEDYSIVPGDTILCKLGFAMEVPKGYCMKIMPRSEMAKDGITIVNSPGIVDSDYVLEVGVLLHKLSPSLKIYEIKAGHRIAQGRIEKNIEVEFEEVEELSETDRKGGFGSTGK